MDNIHFNVHQVRLLFVPPRGEPLVENEVGNGPWTNHKRDGCQALDSSLTSACFSRFSLSHRATTSLSST
jgi:hypothetical protein